MHNKIVTELLHRDLTEKVIGIFFDVYNELGCGFLEEVYAKAMAVALEQAGCTVRREVSLQVWFRGENIGQFFADMIVNEVVILEFKAARSIDVAFEKQLLNYLRGTDLQVGLLLNFGTKPEFRRLAFENSRKIRVYPRASAAKKS